MIYARLDARFRQRKVISAENASLWRKATLPETRHEPLSTTEDVPERLKEQAEALLETGEEIKVSVSTDLRFDGTYGKDWLLITNRRLIAFNQNGVLGHHMCEVPLSSIEDVEIQEMYGNNILKVTTTDNAFELSRYSNRLTRNSVMLSQSWKGWFHKWKRIQTVDRAVDVDRVELGGFWSGHWTL